MSGLPGRIESRCMGVTGYGFRCLEASTHCVRGIGRHWWSCRQHLGQLLDTAHESDGLTAVTVSAVAWHTKRKRGRS